MDQKRRAELSWCQRETGLERNPHDSTAGHSHHWRIVVTEFAYKNKLVSLIIKLSRNSWNIQSFWYEYETITEQLQHG